LNGSFSEIVVIAAFEHHRNFDGSGYPVSRKKRRPSLISRIIMIADFYDAVRGIRSYSTEKAPEEVFALMQNLKGKKFDPELLDLFFHIIGMYPPGTHVQLTTGETAIVTAHNPRDIFRPAVRLVTDAAGTPLEDGPEIALDEKHNNLFIRSVSRSLQLSGDST
jgi:HD-GYP domain-containing protein (c-di-GMP phosphodiesterase class II)